MPPWLRRAASQKEGSFNPARIGIKTPPELWGPAGCFWGISGLAAAEVDNEADNEAEAGGEEPAEVQVEQRQVLPGKGDQPVEMQRTLHACGQRLHEIEDRGSPGEGHDGDIDGLVMVEEFADEGQDDQRDRGRVDEHEHGDGILR